MFIEDSGEASSALTQDSALGAFCDPGNLLLVSPL